MEKLLVFDLDDTIFETKSIGAEAVEPLIAGLETILQPFYNKATIGAILEDSWSQPFDHLAKKYSFDPSIVKKFVGLINESTFKFDIEVFEDFKLVPPRPEKKILVTTGFAKLQWSKIEALAIDSYFEEIIIDDQADNDRILKKGIFEQIQHKYQVKFEHMVIVGDNPKSELKAGHELGAPTVQVSKLGQSRSHYSENFIEHYHELLQILDR